MLFCPSTFKKWYVSPFLGIWPNFGLDNGARNEFVVAPVNSKEARCVKKLLHPNPTLLWLATSILSIKGTSNNYQFVTPAQAGVQ
jgi:hypothetical protein